MIFKTGSLMLRVQLVGWTHVRMARVFGCQRSADSHFYCPTPESVSICAAGREAQQNGQMPRDTSFPPGVPQAHLHGTTSSVVASSTLVNHK